jgi:hypothetical protein
MRQTFEFMEPDLEVASYLSAWSDFGVLVTLRQYGLLYEEQVRAILEGVKDLAAQTPDADFLMYPRVRRFFTDAEIDEIMAYVRQVLVPNLDDTLWSWRMNYRGLEDAASYFSSLTEALEAFRDYFATDDGTRQAMSSAIEEVDQLISECNSSDNREDKKYGLNGAVGSLKHTSTTSARRIFDDLDDLDT